jgi:hypothetical protein
VKKLHSVWGFTRVEPGSSDGGVRAGVLARHRVVG